MIFQKCTAYPVQSLSIKRGIELPTVVRIHVRNTLKYTGLSLIVSIGLEHASIRDNIVFDSTYGYDKARYEKVVEACALLPDFEILPDRDLTGTFHIL